MGLLCYGTCPFFDKRKVGWVYVVLHQLVTEAARLSAGWLDDSHEYGSNLLYAVGLGRNASTTLKDIFDIVLFSLSSFGETWVRWQAT